ncbi:MAG: hypothetical protein WCR58_08090 [Bacteroidales bacterium]|jgi:hypothetical protein|nr:porin family protein [Bacteroidales bacterium]MDD3702110.1 hypothetical protein [Bacteroidales bacterium]MDY0369603.1 hypothetical protein [Bacteroidales bacterium]
MKRLSVISIVALLLATTQLFAQKSIHYPDSEPPWTISAAGGTSIFLGDIKQNKIMPTFFNKNELRFVAALGVEYSLSNSFRLRGRAAYSHVIGTHRPTNRYFQSFVYEGNLSVMFYPINAIWGYDPDRVANIYLLAGIGIVNYNSTLYTLDLLQTLGTRGYGNGKGISGMTLDGVAVGGLGLDVPLGSLVSLRFEMTNHMISSDEMDVVVSGFKYDAYNQFTVGLAFHFGSSKKSKAVIYEEAEPVEITIPREEPEQIEEPVIIIEEVKPEPEIIPEILEEKPVITTPERPEREYRVQILNNGRKTIDLNQLANRYRLNVHDIEASIYNGQNIYTCGGFVTYEEAVVLRDKLKSVHGIHDAFIVPFVKGQRVAKMPQ